MPSDWAHLSVVAGVRSFIAAPIQQGSEVVGVLTLADTGAKRFLDPRWVPGCVDPGSNVGVQVHGSWIQHGIRVCGSRIQYGVREHGSGIQCICH